MGTEAVVPRGEGGGHPGRRGPAGQARPPARRWDKGRVAAGLRARVEPGTPGLPGGAGPRTRLTPSPARGPAPPGRHGDRKGGREEAAARLRRQGLGWGHKGRESGVALASGWRRARVQGRRG